MISHRLVIIIIILIIIIIIIIYYYCKEYTLLDQCYEPVATRLARLAQVDGKGFTNVVLLLPWHWHAKVGFAKARNRICV